MLSGATRQEVWKLHCSDPKRWTHIALARHFSMSEQRAKAVILLQRESQRLEARLLGVSEEALKEAGPKGGSDLLATAAKEWARLIELIKTDAEGEGSTASLAAARGCSPEALLEGLALAEFAPCRPETSRRDMGGPGRINLYRSIDHRATWMHEASGASLVVKFNLPGAPTTFSEVMDSAAASDHSYYYSILVPMTLPACVIFVFLNWVSVMFFKNA